MRSFYWFACCLLFAANVYGQNVAGNATQKTNIILILTDDQCFETIAALGNSEVRTPNLDKLAHSGVSFTNAYNMGGWHGAICIASRTMMNTGRFLWRALEREDHLKDESQARRFLAQYLHDAGYETYLSGKWHVKIAPEQVFDHVAHVRPGMPKDTPSSYQRSDSKSDWQPWDRSLGGFWEGGKHWSEVLADDADHFLESASQSDKPFFMYLAFNAPHDPRQSPREFVDLYPREKIRIPANFMPEYPFMDAMGADRDLRDEKLAPWPRTHEAVQLHRQEYFAAITHLDQQIGRILQQLERVGKTEQTLIVMTADHGLACGQHGLLGKQNMFEHSLKAPLIVAGPGIPANKRIATPVYIQDFFPTALEVAQVDKPEQVEFKSLLPLIRGERQQQYPTIYAAYREDRQRMVRRDKWKLIYYPTASKYLMFDLDKDPHEINDLSDDPKSESIKKQLFDDLKSLMKSMDDPLLKK